ncbi:MAG: response regulator [Myxococcota bacterium]
MTRRKLLVVDDEPHVGTALRRLLSREFDVATTTQAQAALDMLQRGEQFDLIICDLMMPEMTGMDFHERLAECCPQELRKVVFLTGGAFTDRARQFLNHQTNPVLEKPVEPEVLRDVVRRMVHP